MDSKTIERKPTLAELVAELRKPYLVEYAYATSDTARVLGHWRTGCWFVSGLVDGDINKPRRVVSSHGYTSKEEAQGFADIYSKGEQVNE